MKKMFEEFKAFIMRGNVLDMAVGVIVAGAFGKITTSLVNDLFMPFISWIFGARDMTALNVVVRPEIVNEAGEVIQAGITLGFGTFVATIIDFILIALVVFMVVKLMNAAKAKLEKKEEEEAPAEEPAEPEPTKEELLLADIRDLLKNK